MPLTIEMGDPEKQIMEELTWKDIRQRDVAITYAFLSAQEEGKAADWPAINEAIMDRWNGEKSLRRVKNMAGKIIAEWERKGRNRRSA